MKDNCKQKTSLQADEKIRHIFQDKEEIQGNNETKYLSSFSPNLLNGKFEAEREKQIWTSDITYIRTNEGWMYLAVILDVFNAGDYWLVA